MMQFLGRSRFNHIENGGAALAGVLIGSDHYLAGFGAFVITAGVSFLIRRAIDKWEGWKL